MSRLPQGLTFGFITSDEVDAAYEIESKEFPSDEAASLEQFRMRQELAPSLFLGAFLPPSSPNSKRTLIGYVNSTRSSLSTLTGESMKKHDPEGTSVCVHGVVVASEYQRRGIALALLQDYIARMRLDGLAKRVLLICHEYMRPLYEKAGFYYVGPSPVVHGAHPWHEMRIDLDKLLNSDEGRNSGDAIPQSTAADVTVSPFESFPPGLLETLQQSGSTRSQASPQRFSSFPGGVNDVSMESNGARTNKYDILCPRSDCRSIILKAGVGTLVDKELEKLEPAGQPPASLLRPLPPTGSVLSCWLVQPNPMAFENIGFSRAVDRRSNDEGPRPRLKLLSCADCDLGPLGWCVEGGRDFWLICARVGYRA